MLRPITRRLIRHARSISAISTKRPRIGLALSEEVEHALQHGRPVVALETAILTHGMPPPTNVETCLLVERRVRESGAVPATIGILRGKVHIGLSKEQLVELAVAKPSVKVSRRDISAACASKAYGGTTIAGTMVLAHLAGIRVFATGGLGGVHRGGEVSMDVSADLTELGRTPVAVVASGPKSILDIGRTLEYLETQGVPVISYSKTKDFPSFFTPKSGFKSPWNVTSPIEAARIIHHGVGLGMTNGYFFGVPIPEIYEALGAELQLSVERAIKESEENGINKSGKHATPWLLNRIYELTGGQSIESNIALIENTARVGGSIAVEFAKLLNGENETVSHAQPVTGPRSTVSILTSKELPPAKLAVIGIAAVDIIAKAETNKSGDILKTTSKGAVRSSLGGVGRNVAEATHRSLPRPDSYVLLISPVGQDQFASQIQATMGNIGMRTDGLVQVMEGRTPVVNMVLLGDGSLIGGVADISIADKISSKEVVALLEKHALEAIALDANLSPKLMTEVCLWARTKKIPVYYEPTSVQKSLRIVPVVQELIKAQPLNIQPGIFTPSPIHFISPNRFELEALWSALQEQGDEMDAWKWEAVEDACIGWEWRESLEKLAKLYKLRWLLEDGVALQIVNLLPYFQNVVLKCGEQGVLIGIRAPLRVSNFPETNVKNGVVVSNGRTSTFMLKYFPAQPIEVGNIMNVTGAGDTLVGSLLASSIIAGSALFEDGVKLTSAIDRAQRAACATLKCEAAVSPDIGRLA